MMGLEQIKAANENPTDYGKSGLSDGQRRRNDDKGKAFWSEQPAYTEAAITTGESMQSMADKEMPILKANAGIDNLSAAADEGRAANPGWMAEALGLKVQGEHPLPQEGRIEHIDGIRLKTQGEHPLPNVEDQRGRYLKLPSAEPLPSVYFDGAKLYLALGQMITDFQAQQRQVTIAMGMLKINPSMENAGQLQIVINDLMTDDLRIRMLVNELAATVEGIAPTPHGYTPHMGIAYAMAPVKRLITRIKSGLRLNDDQEITNK